MNYEEEILDYVRQHPGCHRLDLIAATRHPNAGNEADYMVRDGKLVAAYYIPGTYRPPYHIRESEAEAIV